PPRERGSGPPRLLRAGVSRRAVQRLEEPGAVNLFPMAIRTQSVTEVCEGAKRASHRLATLDTATKNGALEAIASELEGRVDEILEANAEDLEDGRAAGLDAALIDRLSVDQGRVQA